MKMLLGKKIALKYFVASFKKSKILIKIYFAAKYMNNAILCEDVFISEFTCLKVKKDLPSSLLKSS